MPPAGAEQRPLLHHVSYPRNNAVVKSLRGHGTEEAEPRQQNFYGSFFQIPDLQLCYIGTRDGCAVSEHPVSAAGRQGFVRDHMCLAVIQQTLKHLTV